MPNERRQDELTRQLGQTRRRKRRTLAYPGAELSAGSLTPGGEIPPIFEVTGCVTITIPAASIDATLTGFVVPYDLSNAPSELWAGAASNGRDLYVKIASSGVRIPAHIFLFDTIAETGFIFFRAPTLSSTVNNDFLLCWGDPTTDFSAAADIDWTSLITNPDAETGDLTGWTQDIGLMLATTASPHSGTYKFEADQLNTRYFQDITVPSADESEVDSGDYAVRIKWYQRGGALNFGMMGFTFLDGASAELDEEWKSSGRGLNNWTQREFTLIPPSGTRKVRIWMESRGNAGGVYAQFDDMELALINVDVNKQWGVWQDYIGVGFFESDGAVNYGPGEPSLNIESFSGNAPVYSALSLGAGAGVTVGNLGAYRGFMGCPLNTDQYSQGVTMIPSDITERQVAIGFTERTSASEPSDESQWIYHDALGELQIQDDVNGVLASGDTLVNGTPYRIHAIHDGTSGRRIYLDGVETAEDLVITAAANDFNTLCLAHEDQSVSEQWEGGLAYLWMRRDVISEEWVAAEYLALNDQATFFNAGVFQGTEGVFLRYDGTDWADTPIGTLRDDLQANAPYGELAVANAWSADQSGAATGSWLLPNVTASATVPTVVPNKADPDTGVGSAAADQLSMIAGAQEAIRFTEASDHVIQDVEAHTGLTASTTQTQGNGALLSSFNEISTVGATNDTVTLPGAAAGRTVVVINDGANTLQVFPASGDDLGQGADTAETIPAGERRGYLGFSTTEWHSA